MTDRRTRYRAYIAALDPTADPERAIDAGSYVDGLSPTGRRVAARLEIDPTSAHLVVGGVGSGKTTELVRVERQLRAAGDIYPVRFDVPAHPGVSDVRPRVLLALAVVALKQTLSPPALERVAPEFRTLRHFAEGEYTFNPWEHDEDDRPGDGGMWIPGVLRSRDQLPSWLLPCLHDCVAALDGNLVLLFDGLDRVDPEAFAALVRSDLPVLRAAGIGVVVVGPQHLRFGPQAVVQGEFTEVHLHGAVDTEAGIDTLVQVLRRRAPPDILPDEAADALAAASGGVLRDLVSMARTAGEEAYSAGLDQIGVEQANAAALRLGRSLILGLQDAHIDALRAWAPIGRVASASPVTVSTPAQIELLLARVIIEIPSTPPRYRVHPAVLPFLRGLRKSA